MQRKVTDVKNKVGDLKSIIEDETKGFDANDVKTVKGKDAIYLTGAKTHPLYFDAMSPELISAMDRPLLKQKTADYIAYLNLKDKQMTLADLKTTSGFGAILTLATAASNIFDRAKNF